MAQRIRKQDVKIAYILLCHQNPHHIAALAETIKGAGDYLVIHFDKNGSDDNFAKLQRDFATEEIVRFAPRLRCGWGAWSLVQATINGLKLAYESFPDATHFYLISGDCAPIKSAVQMKQTLSTQNKDYLEHQDFFDSGWIKTGLVGDRLYYRHFFNERKQQKLFYQWYRFQKRFGLKRKIPKGLEMKIGSQWFCIRRATVKKLLAFIAKEKAVIRFFRSVWIPDECFFQTIVLHLVPYEQVINRPPTFLTFSDYGKPATFHMDQYKLLSDQKHFFARKISTHDDRLRQKLNALYLSNTVTKDTTDRGRRIYEYTVQQGRHGKRFGARNWQEKRTVGAHNTLKIIVSASQRAAEELSRMIAKKQGTPSFGFVFLREDAGLPDMGGLASRLEKRSRHRRAFVRALFDISEQSEMVICLGPAERDVLDDFRADACHLRVLYLDHPLEREDIATFARHRELVDQGDGAIDENVANQIRREMMDELTRSRRDAMQNHSETSYRLGPQTNPDQAVQTIARFLGATDRMSRDILQDAKLLETQ